jgi:hypothetical protein
MNPGANLLPPTPLSNIGILPRRYASERIIIERYKIVVIGQWCLGPEITNPPPA